MARLPTPKPLFDKLDHLSLMSSTCLKSELKFAHNDFIVASEFLRLYSKNLSTFQSYRREIERLCQWSWHIAKKSIVELISKDIEKYLNFCMNPPKSWVGVAIVERFINKNGMRVPNERWRPFVYKNNISSNKGFSKIKYSYKPKTIREIFTVLGIFYNFLLLQRKIESNPLIFIRQKSYYIQKQQEEKRIRRLNENQWHACIESAKSMFEEDYRILFIISAMYLMYLRISEFIKTPYWTPTMGDFYQDSSQLWWFKTVGKGNKMRNIAVSDNMLHILMDYRKRLGLTLLPTVNDHRPLVPNLRTGGFLTSTRHIRRLVERCFRRASDFLRSQKMIIDAENLVEATAHWLRHTGISDDINVNKRSIAHVRDDAGHSSIITTDRYNDINLLDRHKSAKEKKLKNQDKIKR